MRKITILERAFFKKKEEERQQVVLPHTWNNLDGQDGGNDYYRGTCTYEILLPAAAPGRKQFIRFEGVNHIAKVFCNGKSAGEHRGGFSSFCFEITKYMRDTDNTLTVDVDNLAPEVYPQKADFTFFGGLYRPVSFIETAGEHFDLEKYGTDGIFVTTKMNGSTRVEIFAVNAEGCMLQLELSEKDSGKSVGFAEIPVTISGDRGLLWEGTVENPHLWGGTKDAFLYQVKAKLIKQGVCMDEITADYGYREFAVEPENGFFLNGKSYPLHGVSRHQDREDKGWALSLEDHQEDMRIIREIGANTIRLAHYQHSQDFYRLCDENGMIVWAEIPFISLFMDSERARQNAVSQMTELILQNYNHPSICFWGISNEITMGGESEHLLDCLKELRDLAHKLDPSRLTTMAHLSVVEPGSAYTAITDLQGYNIYAGWYVGAAEDNGRILDDLHQKMPHSPVALSEYGADAVLAWHSAVPKNHDYTEEYQAYYHEELLKTITERPYLWATYVWNMFDFAADNRNEGGVKGRNQKGLVSYNRRERKDAFYIYQAYWTREPMVHICGERFRDRAPGERDIKVYTNCQRIALYINGNKVEEQEPHNHVCVFRKTELLLGNNEIKAKTESGAVHSICLNGAACTNADYVMPQDEIVAGNWFNEETGEVLKLEYPEGYYSIRDTVGDLMQNPDAAKIFMEMKAELSKISGNGSKGDQVQKAEGDHVNLSVLAGMQLQQLLKTAGAADNPAWLIKLNRRFNAVKKTTR